MRQVNRWQHWDIIMQVVAKLLNPRILIESVFNSGSLYGLLKNVTPGYKGKQYKQTRRIYFGWQLIGKVLPVHMLSFAGSLGFTVKKRRFSLFAPESIAEMAEDKLKSGKSGKKITNPKHAAATGLSAARKKGAKVPKRQRQA